MCALTTRPGSTCYGTVVMKQDIDLDFFTFTRLQKLNISRILKDTDLIENI